MVQYGQNFYATYLGAQKKEKDDFKLKMGEYEVMSSGYGNVRRKKLLSHPHDKFNTPPLFWISESYYIEGFIFKTKLLVLFRVVKQLLKF